MLTIGEHGCGSRRSSAASPTRTTSPCIGSCSNATAGCTAWPTRSDTIGDIYLVGRIPLESVTDDEIDRMLGQVLEAVDADFNTLLELGFRVDPSRRNGRGGYRAGESLNNLRPFEHLIHEDD